MTVRLALPLALVALLGAAQGADASTYLGSADTSVTPDAYACAACPTSTTYGFRQFALRQGTVEAPEDGVLVAASVNAKRIAGTEDPRIAILRPDDDGANLTVVATTPIPITGEVSSLEDLHLPMQRGDSVGFMFRTGEVDLGVKLRPKPDGAVQSFQAPCDPCGMDGGTGMELLMDAVLEPDVDEDGLGDESQDPDGGGLGEDWEDDWFDDWDEGDQLDEDFEFEDPDARERAPRVLRLLDADRMRRARGSLLLRVPRGGRVSASVTLPANRRGEGPFTTILTGEMRVKRAGRVRLALAPTPAGERALSKRRRVRTKVVVAYFPRKKQLELLMRSARF
ncbi:MAG TPA: hypothetical protein VFZ00_05535 [Solirubrobacter sp.]|nr:hypothetical protein [Solirubrobacter sp.]